MRSHQVSLHTVKTIHIKERNQSEVTTSRHQTLSIYQLFKAAAVTHAYVHIHIAKSNQRDPQMCGQCIMRGGAVMSVHQSGLSASEVGALRRLNSLPRTHPIFSGRCEKNVQHCNATYDLSMKNVA